MKLASFAAKPVLRMLGAAAFVLAIGSPALAQPPVANPTVTGPIPAKAPLGDKSHDYPWFTTQHNLAAVGYVEEEYFYEGTASQFDTPNGQDGTLKDSGHKYKTRLIVRRPIDPKKFNGTVLAEWQNVTAGYDLDAHWESTFEQIIRGGYAWVGISAQRVGVQQEPNGLKLYSPTRYASLDVTDGGKLTKDELSYDIFAQGMQAVKHPQGVSPLGPLKAQRVIAIGASQSAARLGTYINSLHKQLGGPVDAYLVFIGGAKIRDDIPVPVMKILSETDAIGQVPSRQPDTAKFVEWEVTGASHAGRHLALNSGSLNRRDSIVREAPVCKYPTWPRTPIDNVLGASYDLIDKWVKTGTPPPSAPKAEVESKQGEIPGRNGQPATTGTIYDYKRDARGNALGGIRLAEFDVATSLSTRENSGNTFCFLYGRYEPFPDEVINQLYPTHADYVAKVKAVTEANIKAGYIEAADGHRTIVRAERSYIGSGDPCKAACRAAQDLEDSTYVFLALNKDVDKMGADVSAITREIAKSDGAKGKPADRQAALKGLDAYIAKLKAMEKSKAISAVSAKELTTAAEGVKTALAAR
jgi:alpha/beta hydrolase family protein